MNTQKSKTVGLTRLVYSKLLQSYAHVEKTISTLSVFTNAVLKVCSKTARNDFSRLETNLSYREYRKDQFLSPFKVWNEMSTPPFWTTLLRAPPGPVTLGLGPQAGAGCTSEPGAILGRAPGPLRWLLLGPGARTRGTRGSFSARRVEGAAPRGHVSQSSW